MLELLKLLGGVALLAAVTIGPFFVWVRVSDIYHQNASYRRMISGQRPCSSCGGSGKGRLHFNPNRSDSDQFQPSCPDCKGYGY